MAVSEGEVKRAREVSDGEIRSALGGNESVIRGNDDAMKVAASIGARIFRVGNAVYVTDDSKIE